MSIANQLAEKFTLYLDHDCQPVTRALGKMTALEVVAALRWHAAEAARLAREAIPAAAFVRAWKVSGGLPLDTQADEARGFIALLREAKAAQDRSNRLLRTITATPKKDSAPLWSLRNGQARRVLVDA